eukprot:GHVH01003012.1.p1 GENE.GHVH01003012.1~~GHVH01003012.1.p1  ORF type:complete len:4454 (-),score=762.62 GHVH01003012.1:53-12439(-)
MPATGFLEAVAVCVMSFTTDDEAAIYHSRANPVDMDNAVVITDIAFERPFFMDAPDHPHECEVVSVSIASDGAGEVVAPFSDETSAFMVFKCDHLRSKRSKQLTPPFEMWSTEKSANTVSVDLDLFYSELRDAKMQYGPNFRTIQSLDVNLENNSVQASLLCSRSGNLDSYERAFRMHPALLDGCFQSAAALIKAQMLKSDPDLVNVQAQIPFGIAELHMLPHDSDTPLIANVKLVSSTSSGSVLDLRLSTPWGAVVGYIKGLETRVVPLSPPAMIPKSLTWQMSLKKLNLPADFEEVIATSPRRGLTPSRVNTAAMRTRMISVNGKQPGSISVQQLLQAISALKRFSYSDDERPILSGDVPGQFSPPVVADEQFLNAVSTVIYYPEALSACNADSCTEVVLELSTLVGALLRVPKGVTLPIVYVAFESDSDDVDVIAASGGVRAFGVSARLELEVLGGKMLRLGSLGVTRELMACPDKLLEVESLVHNIVSAEYHETDLMVSAIDGDLTVMVPRMKKSDVSLRGPVELHLGERGSIANLSLRPQASTMNAFEGAKLPEGAALIRVKAVGLNFRDVLNVMGLYPGDPGAPGADCAGTVVAVGPGVKHISAGDRVFGIARGCLQSFAVTDARLVVPLPPSIDFVQASSLPVAGSTVLYSLRELAGVKAGQNVLIHAVTGAVGLTALHYCLHKGARVFGTCGSEAKVAFALSAGVNAVGSSRSPEEFERELTTFVQAHGKIDVVLNSLIDKHLDLSLQYLSERGHFVELGKRGILTDEEFKSRKPHASYHVVAVDVSMERDPDWFNVQLTNICDAIASGELAPPPCELFDVDDDKKSAIDAFRHMQRAKHIGKIVIRFRSAVDHCVKAGFEDSRVPKVYVITGGTGYLGLVTAQHLLEEGCDYVILSSRSGRVPDEYTALWLSIKSSFEDRVEVVVGDATEDLFWDYIFDKCNDMRVAGIIHAAGVLRDLPVQELTFETTSEVVKPKVNGLLAILRALARDASREAALDTLLVYSSVSSLIGNVTQCNYTFANGSMEAVMAWRNRQGKVGTVIAWGPWLEGGMAANLKGQLAKVGMRGIKNDTGTRVISDSLRTSEPYIAAQVFNFVVFTQRYDKLPSFYEEVDMNLKSVDMNNIFGDMSHDEAMAHIRKVVQEAALDILGSKEAPPLDAPLQELGIDSLGAVEFRNVLQSRLAVRLPVTTLFDYPTLGAIMEFIQGEVVKVTAKENSAHTVEKIPLQIHAHESAAGRVAVLGVGLRLPGASNSSDFWSLLESRDDAIKPVPYHRWDAKRMYDSDMDVKGKCYVYKGGFMENAELFDNAFFRVPSSEAHLMDPQQRMILQCSYEAMYNSGYDRSDIIAKQWGVYVGCCNFDWHFLPGMFDPLQSSSYSGTGASGSLVSNRISYVFGLTGPSFTVDTACSSSLVSIDSALKAMRLGACEGALVGGVNLMLASQPYVAFCKARMLSKTMKCFTFDSRADGYVRGEGCGVALLVPESQLSEAQRSAALGYIRGSAVNHDGRSASLTAPNGPSQQAVVRDAFADGGLTSHSLNTIECHGTGTALGDPIEIGALTAVFKGMDHPVILGAVKSRLGHLEGSAGIIGFLKLLISLRRSVTPANLNFEKLNPHIQLDGFKAVFPKRPVAMLPIDGASTLVGGVSSFGFGGTNSHVVLEAEADSRDSETVNSSAPPVFLFTGQGSHWAAMGSEPRDHLPGFAKRIAEYSSFLKSIGCTVEMEELLYDESVENLSNPLNAQLSILCLELGVSFSLRELGVEATAVIGHSLGEFAAACYCGVMTEHDCLRLVFNRAQIMSDVDPRGGVMAAVRVSVDALEAAISELGLGASVSCACDNGPKSVVVGGDEVDVARVLESMGLAGRWKKLQVSHAFHSPLMEPSVVPFGEALEGIALHAPREGCSFISTSLGVVANEEVKTPEYWCAHILRTVRFRSAVKVADALGHHEFLEVGPREVLSKMAKYTLGPSACTSSLVEEQVGLMRGKLQRKLHGEMEWTYTSFDWRPICHHFLGELKAQKVEFEHKLDERCVALVKDHVVNNTILVPGAAFIEMMVSACWCALSESEHHLSPFDEIHLKDVAFEQALALTENKQSGLVEPVSMKVTVDDGPGTRAVTVRSMEDADLWILHATGAVAGVEREVLSSESVVDLKEMVAAASERVDVDALYAGLRDKVRLQYGPSFRCITECYFSEDSVLARLDCPLTDRSQSGLQDSPDVHCFVHPGVLDGAFQTVAVALVRRGITTTLIPVGVGRVSLVRCDPLMSVWGRCVVIKAEARSVLVDVSLFDSAGVRVGLMEGLKLSAIDTSRPAQVPRELYWETEWQVPEEEEVVEEENVVPVKNVIPVFIEADSAAWSKELLKISSDQVLVVSKAESSSCRAYSESVLELCQAVLAHVNGKKDCPSVLVHYFPRGGESREGVLESDAIYSAGIVNMVRSARLEIEEQLDRTPPLRTIHSRAAPQECLENLSQQLMSSGELDFRFEGGELNVLRLVSAKRVAPRGPVEMHLSSRGAITNLQLRPQDISTYQQVPPGCVTIRVRAGGLNFRDVLNVMGLYPGDPGAPGADCAGTVVAVGDGVDLKLGDRVFGIAPGCLRHFVTTKRELLCQMPEGMSFEEASSLPVIACTVLATLDEPTEVTSVVEGDKVLVHAVTGGVGLTALKFCLNRGATVYGSCGSAVKQAYALEAGCVAVGSSRDPSAFDQSMKDSLSGAKLDIVVNSLIDEFIPVSLSHVRDGGVFIELGKRSIWSVEQMKTARPDVHYHVIAVDQRMEDAPEWFAGMLDRVVESYLTKSIQPVPLEVFDITSADESNNCHSAMRFMQRAEHIGKVIVKNRGAVEAGGGRDVLGTCVISGGTGALGMLCARLLAQEGASHVALLSRGGAVDASSPLWAELEAHKCQVAPFVCDASDEASVEAFFTKLEANGWPRVVGFIHAAGVLRDCPLAEQSRALMGEVSRPKVEGAVNFHNALQRRGWNEGLNHFIMFSSTAAMVGNHNQANYSSANGQLDHFAQVRADLGMCAQSIQFGPWTEQGMAVNLLTIMEGAGFIGLTNDLGCRAIIDALRTPEATVFGANNFLWKNLVRSRFSLAEAPPFLSQIDLSSSGGSGSTEVDMLTVEPSEVITLLQRIVRDVSGSGDLPDANTALMDLSMDSLGAVEFRNVILESTGIKLPQSITFDNPTLEELARYILCKAGRTDVPSFIMTDLSVVDMSHRVFKHGVMEWMQSVFQDGETHLLYCEAFTLKYKTSLDLVKEDDFDGALTEMGITGVDRDKLFVQHDSLRQEVFSAATNAGGLLKNAQRTSCKPHPLDDVDELRSWTKERLSSDLFESILPPVAPDCYKRVFLTGGTGFVGRLQVLRLVEEFDEVFALIRCSDEAHGWARLRDALVEADEWADWEEKLKEKLTIIPGDFTKPKLGCSDETWMDLSAKIDVVYHTGGDVNLVSGYLRLRETNTLSMKPIIELASSVRVKPIHFTSTLGQFPEFFGTFSGEFSEMSLTEDSTPDMDHMEKFYPPRRQGYPWSKWAAEQAIKAAAECGIPCGIYRLPNTYVSFRKGYTNIGDYASALTISTIEEAMFPISTAAAALTPADMIVDQLIRLSLVSSRQHLVYHLFDPRVLSMDEMQEMAGSLGLKYDGVPCDTFFDAVKSAGPSSPVFKFVPLMQYWRAYWFDSPPRDETFPIRTQNVADDLGEEVEWPALREVFRRSFMYCAEHDWFSADAKSVSIDPEYILDGALAICDWDGAGLGEDREMIIEPSEILQTTLDENEDIEPSFTGRVALSRTFRSYMVNMMSMNRWERIRPHILHEKIVAPVFVVGLNRSGTTFMQNLIASDSRFRSTRFCEMVCPYGSDGLLEIEGVDQRDYDWTKDPRVPFAQETLDTQMGSENDEWLGIHAQVAWMPEEDFVIMEHIGRSYSICCPYPSTEYRDWLFEDNFAKMKEAYGFHKRFLQHLQTQIRSEKWVLKMPFHLFALDAVLEQYPDAKIVFMHRDPVNTIASWSSLVHAARSQMMKDVSKKDIGDVELDTMGRMMQEAIKFRSQCDPSIILDVSYESLVEDPAKVVERVFDFLEMDNSRSDGVADYIKQNLEERKVKAGKRHKYTLEEFGLDEDRVREQFKGYYEFCDTIDIF